MHDRAHHRVENLVENPFVGQYRADRNVTAGQRFGEQDDVRLDAPMLACEEATGASEPGLDFVGDKQRTVLAAELDAPRR